MTADCTFCGVVDEGDGNESFVHGTGAATTFLDIRPLFPGHVLVVPNDHVRTLDALAPEVLRPFFEEVQRAMRAVEEVVEAEGSFVAMNNRVSQSVPHLHCHVVPRSRGDGLRGFFWPRNDYDGDGHRDEVRSRLAAAMAA